MAERTVLVTGGAGFVGGALVDRLRREPDVDVRVLDVAVRPNPPDGVEYVRGDVRDPEAVAEAAAGVDVVFHQAAVAGVAEAAADPRRSHGVNATGTLRVLEAARHTDARVVVASSAAVYGEPEDVPIAETAPLSPVSTYGATKLAADRYARRYHDRYGLETVVLRYFNVYGPGGAGGDCAGVIDGFLERARRGEPIPVHGDGEQTRDFVHVDDVVRANRLAATTDAVGEAFNVATGDAVTIARLAELVRDAVGSESPIVRAAPREGDVRHSRADLSRARSALEFEPEIDLETGVATLLDRE